LLYENVIEVLDHYKGIDVMGEFYTTFLRFTKGNAKEKGIVLTPKHITELFCDIAEYYSDEKMTENTKVIDICCGTGAFLISALARIKENIYTQRIIGLILLITICKHFILPSSYIFGCNLIDFVIFKIRQNFLLNNIFFCLPSAFL